MAITSVGTPTAATSTTITSQVVTVAGTWGTGQTPAAGHLLVAVVTFNATTSAAATAQAAGTSGWTNQIEIGSAATALARVAIWTKIAAGSDAAPSFTSNVAASASALGSVTLYELAGATAFNIVDASGTNALSGVTVSTQTATTSGNVTLAGEFGIAGFARERASVASNVTASGSYTLDTSNTGVTSIGHFATMSLASPGAGSTSAATVNYSGTSTTARGAAGVIVFSVATSGPLLDNSIQGPAGVLVSLVRTGVAMASLIPAATAPPPPVTSGPPFFPVPWPARARIPQNAPTGRIASSPGGPVRNPVPPATGPVFYPARQAIRARLPQPPAGMGAMRGRCAASPPAPVRNPAPGPVFRLKPAPVRYVLPPRRPRAGRIGSSFGAPVVNPHRGPPFYPFTSEVRSAFPQQPFLRGRVASSPGAPVANPGVVQVNGATGGPVRASLPPNQRGRVRATPLPAAAGTPPVHAGPPFFPFTQAARARLPRLPLLRGRIASNAGAPARNPSQGPGFRQAVQPARARQPMPPRGRIASSPGGPVRNPVPSGTGPVFYPRNSAKAQLPLPRRGTCRTIRFGPLPANPSQGPAFTQAVTPARARTPLPPRGRTGSNPGGPVQNPAPSGIGPPFYPFRSPVRIHPSLPPRGRAYSGKGAAVQNPGTGPVVYPLQGEVRSQLPSLHPRAGRVYSGPGSPVFTPTAGPQVYALQGPVRVRLPGPFLKGRASSSKGAPVQNPATGPSFRQATSPVQAKHPLPPRGRVASNIGAPVNNPQPAGTGPAFFPVRFPARARVPQVAPRGRVYSSPGATVKNPVQGPVFRQAVHPASPRIPQVFSKGRVYSNPGAPSVSIGPPVTPPHGPVAARKPLPPRGRVNSSPGAPSISIGPAFRQAVHPVQARAPLPPRGRVYSNPGIQAPPVTAGPKAYPLHGPVQARRPLPPHGRIIAGNPGAPVRNPHQGAVFRSLPWPARMRIPQNAPRGRASGNPGGPVENIPFATLRFRTGEPYFQWDTGSPGFQWATGEPGFQWSTGTPEAG